MKKTKEKTTTKKTMKMEKTYLSILLNEYNVTNLLGVSPNNPYSVLPLHSQTVQDLKKLFWNIFIKSKTKAVIKQ